MPLRFLSVVVMSVALGFGACKSTDNASDSNSSLATSSNETSTFKEFKHVECSADKGYAEDVQVHIDVINTSGKANIRILDSKNNEISKFTADKVEIDQLSSFTRYAWLNKSSTTQVEIVHLFRFSGKPYSAKYLINLGNQITTRESPKCTVN